MIDVRSVHGEYFETGVTSWHSPCGEYNASGPAQWVGLPDSINNHLGSCQKCKAVVAKEFTKNL